MGIFSRSASNTSTLYDIDNSNLGAQDDANAQRFDDIGGSIHILDEGAIEKAFAFGDKAFEAMIATNEGAFKAAESLTEASGDAARVMVASSANAAKNFAGQVDNYVMMVGLGVAGFVAYKVWGKN